VAAGMEDDGSMLPVVGAARKEKFSLILTGFSLAFVDHTTQKKFLRDVCC
jgi:hypothetical protein